MENFDFGNILWEEKWFENILISNISYKTLIGPDPLRIRFSRVYRFIRVYYGTRYLVLFGPGKYDVIYNNRYIISQKSGFAYVFFDNYAKLIHMILYL